MEQKKCAKCGKSLMVGKDTILPCFAITISTRKLEGKKSVAKIQQLTRPYKVNTEYPVCPKCLLDTFLR